MRTLHEGTSGWNGIEAAGTAWAAAQNAPQRHPAAAHNAMLMHGNRSVLRAGGLETAGSARHACASMQNRRKHKFVEGMQHS